MSRVGAGGGVADSGAWLDRHFGATSELTSLGRELRRMANAFGVTGNDGTAKILDEISTGILAASEAASDAMSQSVHESCERSRQQLGDTAGLVLGHILKDHTKAISP